MSELEEELDQVREEIASITREEAITWAAKYGLIAEVIYRMDHLDMTPAEALAEWDIL
jgi:adenine-specific DNA methylase